MLPDLRLPDSCTAKSSVALQCSRCTIPLSSSHPNSHTLYPPQYRTPSCCPGARTGGMQVSAASYKMQVPFLSDLQEENPTLTHEFELTSEPSSYDVSITEFEG